MRETGKGRKHIHRQTLSHASSSKRKTRLADTIYNLPTAAVAFKAAKKIEPLLVHVQCTCALEWG